MWTWRKSRLTLIVSGPAINQETNIFRLDGVLRIHIIPKVANHSIVLATEHLKPTAVPPEEDGPEKRFMVVRHPCDRIVSCWQYFCHDGVPVRLTGTPGMGLLGYYDGMPLTEFAEICLLRHDENRHTMKQICFTGGHHIDYLAPFEQLDACWHGLSQAFPALKLPDLQHTHKTEHRYWQEYWPVSLRDEVEEEFYEDVLLHEQALTFTGEFA